MSITLHQISSFLSGVGLSPALVSLVLIIVLAWLCVDFYEEHFR